MNQVQHALLAHLRVVLPQFARLIPRCGFMRNPFLVLTLSIALFACTGNAAAGDLILDGGAMNTHVIGFSNGTYYSDWVVDEVRVGDTTDYNKLWIEKFGHLTTTNHERVYVGFGSSSAHNTLTVDGPGSRLDTTTDWTFVGLYGDYNHLRIWGGGTVNSYGGFVGYYSMAYGNNVEVDGSGSEWNLLTENLYVGLEGDSNGLSITGGGSVDVQAAGKDLRIGHAAGSIYNFVYVSGAGSSLTVADSILVGENGPTNTLRVADGGTIALGGTLDTANGTFYFNGGTIRLDGASASWDPGSYDFQPSSAATLEVINGASVSNVPSLGDYMTVHDNAAVQVSSGSSLTARHQYRIDDGGSTVVDGDGSTLTVTDAGTNYSGRLHVGHTTGGRGTMTVSGGADVTAESGVHVAYHSSGLIGAGSTGADALQVDVDGDGLVDGSQLTITGAGSTVVTGDGSSDGWVYVGAAGENARLYIKDGGVLSTGSLNISSWLDQDEGGTASGGSGDGGYVKVTGAGSTASVSGQIEVGRDGYNGRLDVLSGGSVTAGSDLNVGESATSTGNSVLVSGASGGSDATLSVGGGFYLGGTSAGAGGTGTATIESGGVLSVTGATRIHSGNTMTLSGGELDLSSSFTNEGTFDWQSGTVNMSSGSSLVLDGGTVNLGTSLDLGDGTFDWQSGMVDLQSGSDWSPAGNLDLTGSKTLTLSGGELELVGSVTQTANLDWQAGTVRDSSGTTTVVGSGGLLGGNVSLGTGRTLAADSGAEIQSGGTLTLSGGELQLGGGLTNNGTFDWQSGTVDLQSGSDWSPAGDLDLTGSKTLTLSGGELSLAGAFTEAGNFDWQGGTVTVSGAGSTWDKADLLIVDNGGAGTLTVSAGGSVTNSEGYVGYAAGSDGTATVRGAGSSWASSSSLRVGRSGTGTLTVSDGGSVTNDAGHLGFNKNGNGMVTVTGAGSMWDNSLSLYLGRYGTGTLTVSDGGNVTNATGYVGYLSSGNGTATVTGAGSSWSSWSDLHIGGGPDVSHGGDGTITVSDGGSLTNFNGTVGYSTGGSGVVNVTGAGSSWANGGDLIVGGVGSGELTVSDGGSVTNDDGFLCHSAWSIGHATVTGAGSSWANSGNLSIGIDPAVSYGYGTATVADGGTLNVGGVTTVYSGSSLTLGTSTFTSGGIEMVGGTIAASTAAGENGGLFLADVGQISGYGYISLPVHLGETGVVAGSGSGLYLSGGLTGSGSVSDAVLGGSVDIGNSPGAITLEDVLVADNTTFDFSIQGTDPSEYDRLILTGDVTLAGMLDVELINSFNPQIGDIFDLFALEPGVNLQGAFSNIDLPAINTGSWDTSTLLTNGSISVIPEPGTGVLLAIGLVVLGGRRRLSCCSPTPRER